MVLYSGTYIYSKGGKQKYNTIFKTSAAQIVFTH